MVQGLRCALLMLVLAAGGLAACTPPTPVDNNANEVSFRWQKGQTSAADASRVAKDHCQSWGKQAVPAERSADGGAEFERFDCR
jgi:hypothetical protein